MDHHPSQHGVQRGFNRGPARSTDDCGIEMLENLGLAGIGLHPDEVFAVEDAQNRGDVDLDPAAVDSLSVAVSRVPLALMAMVLPPGNFTEVLPPPACTKSGRAPTACEISIS